ncbi:GNAT family N-acetyltransferase [Sphingopyxis sp. MWB1]|uniref:GNAT family N-acetyltransferase n=1 Tax=Sphingopyxis sp. MWB1 TaxID=1537715 RepID=UPI00051A26AA|nr:GNAT family N-acetyltransferase [Sphingopyxis sp. MWB1]
MQARPAATEDMAAWAAMRARLWPDAEPGELAGELPAMLADTELWNFILVDGDQRPIGFAEVRLRSMFDGCDVPPYPHLEGIWVAEEHRRSGGAAALLTAIETRARAEGHEWIGSDVELSNEGSQKWHDAHGFEEANRIILYSKKL